MFRTSDIVLIAVMVSAAAFTYKTKHEAEEQLATVQQDRGADPLRGGHDRPAQGRLEPADPAVAPAEAGRDLQSAACTRSRSTRARSSGSTTCRQNRSTSRTCRRSGSAAWPTIPAKDQPARIPWSPEASSNDRRISNARNDRQIAEAPRTDRRGRLDRRRGRAQGDRRQGQDPRRDDHGGVLRHLCDHRRAAGLSRLPGPRHVEAGRRAG